MENTNKVPFFRIKGGKVDECFEWFGKTAEQIAADEGVVKADNIQCEKEKAERVEYILKTYKNLDK